MIRSFAVLAYLIFLALIIKDIIEIRQGEPVRCIICYQKQKDDGTIMHLKSCPDFKEPKPTTRKR